jgi:hypothetical protein
MTTVVVATEGDELCVLVSARTGAYRPTLEIAWASFTLMEATEVASCRVNPANSNQCPNRNNCCSSWGESARLYTPSIRHFEKRLRGSPNHQLWTRQIFGQTGLFIAHNSSLHARSSFSTLVARALSGSPQSPRGPRFGGALTVFRMRPQFGLAQDSPSTMQPGYAADQCFQQQA